MKIYTQAAVDNFCEKYPDSIVDVIPGVLVDSIIFWLGDDRWVLIKEQYINPWSSGYTFHNFNSEEKCYLKLGYESREHMIETGISEGWLSAEEYA